MTLQPESDPLCLDRCRPAGLSKPFVKDVDVDEPGADECGGELEVLLAEGDELGDHQVIRLQAQPATRLRVRPLHDDDSLEPLVRKDRNGDRDSLAIEAVGAMELGVLSDESVDAIGDGQIVIVQKGEVCLDRHGRCGRQIVLVVGTENCLTAQPLRHVVRQSWMLLAVGARVRRASRLILGGMGKALQNSLALGFGEDANEGRVLAQLA